MTEISTPPQLPENDNTTQAPSSPWVMLITMLLLISGLILTSVMLLHYAMDGKKGASGNPAADFVSLWGESMEPSGKAQADKNEGASESMSSTPTSSNPLNFSFKRFFSGGKDDGTLRWPKLKVTGFGKSTDNEAGFAIINGKYILVNSYIGEVKLVEIRTHGAVVEYKGERKTLTVEGSR